MRIIGVVADAKQGGMEKEVGSEYFIPHRQIPKFGFAPRAMSLIVKTEGDPLAQAEPIRRIVSEMDSTLPIANITTMDQAVYDSIASQRFMTMLLSAFGILAACLATVGIYSVMAFSVAERTNEFGIRMALGAERKDVMRNVLIQGGTLAMIGIGFGLVMTFILARLLTLRLNDILFDLSPNDPVTLIGVSLLLITTAIVACVIPARRATRVDPMVALRYE
ncbi:MAG: FtsX-like permease family protein [Planctomycetes bacterium]|nr:FtsX-like permease family protein [Planctomycetota bacterium]